MNKFPNNFREMARNEILMNLAPGLAVPSLRFWLRVFLRSGGLKNAEKFEELLQTVLLELITYFIAYLRNAGDNIGTYNRLVAE